MTTQGIERLSPRQSGQLKEFLEQIAIGTGPLTAAISVGWTPAKLRELQSDPSTRELIDQALEMRYESVVEMLYRLAGEGQFRAIEMILHEQHADRGWSPPAQRVSIAQRTEIQIKEVAGVTSIVRQMLESGNVAALQPGGALDEILDVESEEVAVE